MRVETWTRSKSPNPERNEDRVGWNDTTLVLADGATDMIGFKYPSGHTGGHELADIAVKTALGSYLNGYELADEVNEAVRAFYQAYNPEALTDPSKRAATTLVVVRFMPDSLVVTQIGDSNVRIGFSSGEQRVLTNDKLIDDENAHLRAERIRSRLDEYKGRNGSDVTGEELEKIVSSGRNVIIDRLKKQYLMQNSPTDTLHGYGKIDGSHIPKVFDSGTSTQYVKTYEYAEPIKSIELVSDGFYNQFPEVANIEAYADLYDKLHAEDPQKYQKYVSTKPLDDATVVAASLDILTLRC